VRVPGSVCEECARVRESVLEESLWDHPALRACLRACKSVCMNVREFMGGACESVLVGSVGE
jgi:hypothetical protein